MSESPEERSLRLAREDPDLLDRLAGNLYEHETLDDDWDDLPEYEREVWRQRTLAELEAYFNLPPVLREVTNKVDLQDYLRDRGRL